MREPYVEQSRSGNLFPRFQIEDRKAQKQLKQIHKAVVKREKPEWHRDSLPIMLPDAE
jgi:hypothetical protein